MTQTKVKIIRMRTGKISSAAACGALAGVALIAAGMRLKTPVQTPETMGQVAGYAANAVGGILTAACAALGGLTLGDGSYREDRAKDVLAASVGYGSGSILMTIAGSGVLGMKFPSALAMGAVCAGTGLLAGIAAGKAIKTLSEICLKYR